MPITIVIRWQIASLIDTLRQTNIYANLESPVNLHVSGLWEETRVARRNLRRQPQTQFVIKKWHYIAITGSVEMG